MAQEGAFARIALDQMDMRAGPLGERDGEHQAGEAGAGAEIRPSQRLRLDRQQLERVGDMPGPHLGEGAWADEVLDLLPAPELVDQDIELPRCFT